MKKKIAIVFVLVLVVASMIAYNYYQKIFKSNTGFQSETKDLYIPSDSNFDDLLKKLESEKICGDIASFQSTASLKKFDYVKPGRYIIKKGMSNQELINKLRIGEQDPVKLSFNNVRTKPELAGKISRSIELDSLDVLQVIMSSEIAASFGFKDETFISMFLPDTYLVNWNLSKDELLAKFAAEYKSFWSAERMAKAKKLNLSQSEVVTIASIVKGETYMMDEAPKVAGLYLNRIRRKMPLQSDPTLIFAWNDFTIKRVYNYHMEIESPYNTYKYAGIPPGPINLPNKRYIDAVLDYEDHDYIFMCAKADLSGYHNFAKTNRQHEIYAAQYRRAINAKGIR